MWELPVHSTQCFLHSTQCFYGEGRRFLVQGRIVCLWYCCNYHFSSKTDNVSRGLIKVALLNCSLFFGLQLDKVFEFFAQQLLCFIPKEFTSHIICSKDLEYTYQQQLKKTGVIFLTKKMYLTVSCASWSYILEGGGVSLLPQKSVNWSYK